MLVAAEIVNVRRQRGGSRRSLCIRVGSSCFVRKAFRRVGGRETHVSAVKCFLLTYAVVATENTHNSVYSDKQ